MPAIRPQCLLLAKGRGDPSARTNQEAKLPQKLPPRSFRREANRIAEYWENHGLESGLTFTSLMCLCQALPKTDWSLLEKYPDTFQELSSMVNRRFQFSWEMWTWYCKFLDPGRVESCALGELSLCDFLF